MITTEATKITPRILSFGLNFPPTQEMLTALSDLVFKPLPCAIYLPYLFGTEGTQRKLVVHLSRKNARAKNVIRSEREISVYCIGYSM